MWLTDNKTAKDKILFGGIVTAAVLLMILPQIFWWRENHTLNITLFVGQLLPAAAIAAGLRWYFRWQEQIIEDAAAKIKRFLSGDTSVRIACDQEGGLYKLLHAVNTLATTLEAHAAGEQQTKEFLKKTIADISHQLKTPLAALSIYNAILQDEREHPSVIAEFTQKTEQEIDRIEVLVQNLLKITRLDAGAIIMEKEAVNLAEMMTEVVGRFETRAELEQKCLTVSGPDTAMVCCDRAWFMEAVGNIVKNALDYTPAAATISVVWQQFPTITTITVKDNGSGIPPEDIHHIFKRFYRRHTDEAAGRSPARQGSDRPPAGQGSDRSPAGQGSDRTPVRQGIGLGLSLTKAIIEAHDGTVTADSIPGQVTAFTINLLTKYP